MTDDERLDAWLEAGAGSGERARQVHETPIAKVYVFADRVLKLKRPVNFGFLDFTTVEKRAWATRRELDLNRRTAPDIYRAIHAVVRDGNGGLRLRSGDHPGRVVDYLLEMRPFGSGDLLADHPDRVDGALGERLGREIGGFQATAPPTPDERGAAALNYVLRSNTAQLRSLAAELGEEPVERLIAATRAEFERLVPLLDRRRDRGFVRRCHGDLHLGNIVVEDGRPILFDCIEFNDVLSEIDIGYDIAFLLMDLSHHGRGDAANRVLNGWLDQTGRRFGAERMDALAALPLFQSVRAAVRAHVSGHGGKVEAARRYLSAAQEHLRPVRPRLAAVGGLSGSGKSTLARALAPRLGSPPGAVVLRSDEVRKRLAGASPTEWLPKSAYTSKASARVYGVLLDEAEAALRAGASVVLDAVFLKPSEREGAQALAHRTGAPFTGLWLEASKQVLRARLKGRRGDASDADEAVLDEQLRTGAGDVAWRRVDATVKPAGQIAVADLT